MTIHEQIAAIVLNQPIEEVMAEAKRTGWVVHIGRNDDKRFVRTMDYRTDRINVEVDNGIVTKFVGIG